MYAALLQPVVQKSRPLRTNAIVATREWLESTRTQSGECAPLHFCGINHLEDVYVMFGRTCINKHHHQKMIVTSMDKDKNAKEFVQ